jgi:glycosyltransferase involved in cell wall biosynthesis
MAKYWELALALLIMMHVLWTWAGSRKPAAAAISFDSPDPWPDVDVIIPSWDDQAVLTRCLRSLGASIRKYPGRVSVCLVVGGRQSDPLEAKPLAAALLSDIPWSFLVQEPLGKNAALNQGLAQGDAPVVVLVDADTEVAEDWLKALVSPLKVGCADAATARFSAFSPSVVSRLYECAQYYNQYIRGQVSLFGGGTIAVRRQALECLGGFDASIPVGVDYHLSESLRQRGFRLAFAYRARVRTEISATWREHWQNSLRWRRAYWWNQRRLFASDRQMGRLIGVVYLPLVGLYVWLGTVGIILTGLGIVPLVPVIDEVWIMGFAWLVGRFLMQSVVVASVLGEWSWIGVLPGLVADYYLGLLATEIGMLTPGRLQVHFKGRRGVLEVPR